MKVDLWRVEMLASKTDVYGQVKGGSSATAESVT
jgi:hypothetical protein